MPKPPLNEIDSKFLRLLREAYDRAEKADRNRKESTRNDKPAKPELLQFGGLN